LNRPVNREKAVEAADEGRWTRTRVGNPRHGSLEGRAMIVDAHAPANFHILLLDCIYTTYTVDAVSEKKPACILPPISPAAGPLYQQIVDGLKREISEGRLAEGAALPSFRQLAGELMVSVITVKRAYEDLEREGIILRRQGLGTYVARNGEDRSRQLKTERAGELLRAAIQEAREAGLTEKEISDLFQHIQNDENP